MRLVVSGGRYFTDEAIVFAALDTLLDQNAIDCIAHGGCEGADLVSAKWAESRGVPSKVYDADWDSGRPAGPMRNERMLRAEKPDWVVTFPGGSGTRTLVEQARRFRLHVLEVEG